MLRTNTFISNLSDELTTGLTSVEELLLREYGSVFIARGGAVPPPTIVFRGPDDVSEFQESVDIGTATIGGFTIELQARAMHHLLEAVREAGSLGLSINPRGADSGRRTYAGTVSLWASRVEPALRHWTGQGRLAPEAAERLSRLAPFEQVSEVLRLEGSGLFFAKDLSKSIIYSVAPPGTSQHLSMLAFDVREFDDGRVRELLARHHWYQTVVSDLPHFTFLGVPEKELPGLGLKRVDLGSQRFWVPDLPPERLSTTD